MDLRKILDIDQIPRDMTIFFDSFVHEFEKSIMGGGEGSIIMFFEEGPREGYSTFFKSFGNVFDIQILQIKFEIAGSRIDVLLGIEIQNRNFFTGKIKEGRIMKFNAKLLEESLAQFIEAAAKKALRDTKDF